MFDIIKHENEIIYMLKDSDIFHNISILEEHIEDFINKEDRNLVFDMSCLDMVDSKFISVCLNYRNKLSLSGRVLRIINYNGYIFNCFQLLNLTDNLLD